MSSTFDDRVINKIGVTRRIRRAIQGPDHQGGERVKANAFDYVRAATLDEALSLLERAGDDGKLLAGGQSLVPALNLRLLAPKLLIDIAHLPELRGISLDDTHIHLGAATRHVELATSPLVGQHLPLLRQAIRHVAHAAIRNRGTLGGNLAHADPASELPACLIALDADLVMAGPGGERRVKATDFFRGLYETALEPDEILVRISIIRQPPDTLVHFNELARRAGDYAMAGLAMVMHGPQGPGMRIRPVYFGIGDRPVLARHAAQCLEEAASVMEGLEEARKALALDLQPQDDLQADAETRMQMAGVLLQRGLAGMMAQGRG